jgi:hypothetical protein
MEEFQQYGEKFNMRAAFTTGAIFGLFLTIGQSWSECFHSLSEMFVEWIRPGNESNILVDFLTAISTSVVCLMSLIVFIQISNGCKKICNICMCECKVVD